MDQILETPADTGLEVVRQAYDGIQEHPNPEWVRGQCPQCGEAIVSNLYYIGGRGYLCVWECWNSLGEKPTCQYRKIN